MGDDMIFTQYKTHDETIKILERKLRIAEMKRKKTNFKNIFSVLFNCQIQ